MATGGRGNGNPNGDHPLDPRRFHRSLSRDDIANQGRYLIHSFIHDRLVREGVQNAPSVDTLIAPGTPTGPPVNKIQEVSRALRCIGDELDNDTNLQELISKVECNAPRNTFFNVARAIFKDGIYNWGRVGALFYFAYKMAIKAAYKIPIIRCIVDWVVEFIQDYVAPWIIGRGGWEAVVEYFGTPIRQAVAVAACGLVLVGFIYYLKKRT